MYYKKHKQFETKCQTNISQTCICFRSAKIEMKYKNLAQTSYNYHKVELQANKPKHLNL